MVKKITTVEDNIPLHTVMNTVLDGLIIIDNEGFIHNFNQAAERIFGYTLNEVVGQNVKMLMPEPYHTEHDGYLTNYLKTGDAKVIGSGREVSAMRKDGSVFPMELGINEMSIGKKRMFVGVIRDISCRKSSEEKLKQSEAKLTAIVDNTVDGLITIDNKGNIETFNMACEKMFGYEKKEVIGKNVNILMPEPYHKEHDGYLKSYNDTGIKKIICIGREVEGKKKDGTVFPIDLSISEVKLGNRKVYSGIVRDITQRKEAEKEIKEAKEHAEQANKAKSLFLATMSHEIRTPLNGIIGVSELLSYCNLDEKTAKYVGIIQTSGELLLTLINDILDFSKIESGDLELESIPVVINSLLEEVIQLLCAKARENNVELALRCPQKIPIAIKTDPVRLRQILINLLSNAIKFSKGGHVLINLDIIKKNKNKVTLRFSIKDTGIGITKDKLSNIFEQFTQADSKTTRKFGGTGLGLAICKTLVELMGGKIGVNSQAGKGSTFWFENSFDIHIENNFTKAAEARKLKDKQILIVDDCDVNLEVFSEYLKQIGVTSETANSPHSALDKLEKAHKSGKAYDIVLVDYTMPKMNGEMLGRTIRDSKDKFGIPKLVLLTSVGKNDDYREIETAIFSDYLTKPIYPYILIKTIIKAIETSDEK